LDTQPAPGSARHSSQSLSRILAIAAVLVITFGTVVRLRQYTARTSFWRDEAFVVLNVRQFTVTQLTGKLNWDQAAAPLFLWSLRGMHNIAGDSELSLRFVPLVSGVFALIAFALLAWRALPPPAAFFAIGLLTLDHRLIDYSTQVKQYSGDVLVASLILLTAFGRADSSRPRRLAIAAIVASITVWFSHTAAIVFGAVSLVLTLQCLGRGTCQIAFALLCNALFAVSLLALYILSIRRQHTDFLYIYWAHAFPDWHHPRTVLPWLLKQLFDLFQTPYRWPGAIFIALALLAIPWARRDPRRDLYAACAATIALVAVASLARQYPLDTSGRLSLFLMPALYLLCGAGAGMLWEVLPIRYIPAWWILPASVLGAGVITSTHRLIQPSFQSHIRPAVQYVQEHRQPGEALIPAGVPIKGGWRTGINGRQLEALCYWPDPPGPLYMKINSPDQVHEKRFWILAAFAPHELKQLDPVLDQFHKIADEKNRFTVDEGGVAILFERR
jgi:hypothetical protein